LLKKCGYNKSPEGKKKLKVRRRKLASPRE